MLACAWRHAAIARAKAASRLAEADPAHPLLPAKSVERWDDAIRWHGEDPILLRGLANALLHAGEVTSDLALTRRALDVVSKLDPDEPRTPLLRGIALATIALAARDVDGMREAIRLFERARATPGTIPPFVAMVLASESEARRVLASLTRDPRDDRRAREVLELLRSYAPSTAKQIERA